eukprot:scaffold236390_cov17-Tisochrysis_lutea.AAC.1
MLFGWMQSRVLHVLSSIGSLSLTRFIFSHLSLQMGIEDGDHIVSDKAGCLIAEYEKWQERAGRY